MSLSIIVLYVRPWSGCCIANPNVHFRVQRNALRCCHYLMPIANQLPLPRWYTTSHVSGATAHVQTVSSSVCGPALSVKADTKLQIKQKQRLMLLQSFRNHPVTTRHDCAHYNNQASGSDRIVSARQISSSLSKHDIGCQRFRQRFYTD